MHGFSMSFGQGVLGRGMLLPTRSTQLIDEKDKDLRGALRGARYIVSQP